MKAYSASGQLQASAVPFTLIAIFNTAARRGKLLQVIVGCSDATPTDTQAMFAVRKITADGTGTASNPTFQADSADGAPVITAKVNYTVEPTYTSGNVAEIPLHNRNTAIWQPPTQDAAVANALGTTNGIGIQMIAGPTSKKYDVTLIWDE